MHAWDIHEREGKPEMANVLKNLVVPQKAAQKMNQVFANPNKEEVT